MHKRPQKADLQTVIEDDPDESSLDLPHPESVSGFTAEENARFQKRHEEGYDVPDLRYDQWIEANYPSTKA